MHNGFHSTIWTWATAAVLALIVLSGTQANALPPEMHPTLQRLADQQRVCAVAVAVIQRRQLASVDTASGCDGDASLTADSVFQAASLSKPVFAYAVLQLARSGRLDLDAPLLRYLPQGYVHRQNPFDANAAARTDLVTAPELARVTARMALNHSTGLPNWASEPLAFSFAPGSAWQYSGEAYVLLQRVVENITGQALDRWMHSQVLAPLGMNHSSYVWTTQWGARLQPGRAASGSAYSQQPLLTPIAAATLYTSATDYAKFLVAVLNDAALLQQIMDQPVQVDTDLGLHWGLGWGLERSGNDTSIWHWGNNPGYRAFVIAAPNSGDGLVLFSNSDNGLALAQPLTELVLPGEHKLFQFHLLGSGVLSSVCKTLRLC